MNNISNNLKILRKEANLSIDELSEKTKIKSELLNAFEAGNIIPNDYQLEVLCQVLRFPCDEIADRNIEEERRQATNLMKDKNNRNNYNWYFGDSKRLWFNIGYIIYFFVGILALTLIYINKWESGEYSLDALRVNYELYGINTWYPYYIFMFFIDFIRIGFSIFGIGISVFMLLDYFSRHEFYFRWWYILWISTIILLLEVIGIFGSIPYLVVCIKRIIKKKY